MSPKNLFYVCMYRLLSRASLTFSLERNTGEICVWVGKCVDGKSFQIFGKRLINAYLFAAVLGGETSLAVWAQSTFAHDFIMSEANFMLDVAILFGIH
jgi:hypothetical protein